MQDTGTPVIETADSTRSRTDWMAVHADELAQAIIEDGFMGGPKSDPMLSKYVQFNGRDEVPRHLLQQALNRRGFGHLLASTNSMGE